MSVKVPPMSIPSEYWATSLLEPQVFRGRRVSVAGDQPRARLGHARTDAPDDDQDDTAELLLPPLGEVGGALHRARLRADADGLEIALDRLGHGVVRRERIEVAALEAVRVHRLRQELLGPRGILGGRLVRHRVLEDPRHEVAGEAREAERLRLVHGLAIDSVARG